VDDDSAPIEQAADQSVWAEIRASTTIYIPVLKYSYTGTTIAARAVCISRLLLAQNRLQIFSVLFYSVILSYSFLYHCFVNSFKPRH